MQVMVNGSILFDFQAWLHFLSNLGILIIDFSGKRVTGKAGWRIYAVIKMKGYKKILLWHGSTMKVYNISMWMEFEQALDGGSDLDKKLLSHVSKWTNL